MLAFPPYLSVQDVLTHPRFSQAFDVFVDGMVCLYGHDVRLRGLLEYRQAVCFQLLVCFDAARDGDRPETLFTTARLAAAMAQMGMTNRRAIAELLGRLVEDGHATVAPASHDRRVREIRATEKARAADREWLEVLHRPLAVLEPDNPRHQPPLDRDVAYQRAFRTASLQTLDVAYSVMEANPEADYFVKSTVGARLMMLLMQSVRDRDDLRTDPGFYDWAAERGFPSACAQADSGGTGPWPADAQRHAGPGADRSPSARGCSALDGGGRLGDRSG